MSNSKSEPTKIAEVKPRSRRREWGFRALAIVGVPLLLFFIVELALRAAGFGYPTHFFISVPGSPGVFAENPKFGWRFFPKSLARAPEPMRVTRAKPAGTYRIFIFGESAALGDPEPAYGFSRILRELLEARCPGTNFEIINVAMTAISSHTIREIAHDCVPFQGDAWIIYMGNNEVVGPFGAGSVFGLRAPPRWLVDLSLAAKRTRVGQLIDATAEKMHRGSGTTKHWQGMEMMIHEQVRATDPSLRRVYQNFESNLRDIVQTAEKAGVKTIVCSVSANLKDCPPFGSLHKSGLGAQQQTDWSNPFAAGTKLESQHDYAGALAQYRRAAEIDDTFAELSYRMARCCLAMGQKDKTAEYFVRARDLDTLRFRADSRINATIRSQWAARGGIRSFDSENAIMNLSATRIPGEECFWDHVHYKFAGNYQIARGLAEQVLSMAPPSTNSPSNFLSRAECAARLAYTDFDERAVLELMWQRVQRPPFVNQLDHDELLERWSGRRKELTKRINAAGLAPAVQTYREAIARRPADWILHYRMASVLDAAGQLAEAKSHWQKAIELNTECVDAWFKLADAASRQSNLSEAEQDFEQVLRLRPESYEALNGMGLLRMAEGKWDAAEDLFRRGLGIAPDFAQARINLGLIYAHRGDLAKAEAAYREALANDPQSVGARVNLANLLAGRKEHQQAIELYQQALALQPEQARVHFALANSLQSGGRNVEAIAHFREAIRLEPALAEAHFNLGLALIQGGDLRGATESFEEAVRLEPQDEQARMNLGVALAKQNRLEEAIPQFQAVLQADPTNAAARQYLQMALARQRGGPPARGNQH